MVSTNRDGLDLRVARVRYLRLRRDVVTSPRTDEAAASYAQIDKGVRTAMSAPMKSIAAAQRFADLREWPRYPISAQCEATERLSGRHLTGLVTVFGRGGCYLRTVDTLHAGAVLSLRIEWHGAVFVTAARVAHAIPGDGMGLAFFDTQESQVVILTQWLEEARLAEHSNHRD